MSGLIGKLSFDPHEPLARPVLEQMLEAPVHQGTNRHIFLAPGIALGVCGSVDLVPGGEHEFAPLRVAAEQPLEYAVLKAA